MMCICGPQEKEIMFVRPATMERYLKKQTQLKSIERDATKAMCAGVDVFLQSLVSDISKVAKASKVKTIDSSLVTSTLPAQLRDLPEQEAYYAFCKTRCRNRVKNLSPDYRWTLGAKHTLYRAIHKFLDTTADEIKSTQELSKKKRVARDHAIHGLNRSFAFYQMDD